MWVWVWVWVVALPPSLPPSLCSPLSTAFFEMVPAWTAFACAPLPGRGPDVASQRRTTSDALPSPRCRRELGGIPPRAQLTAANDTERRPRRQGDEHIPVRDGGLPPCIAGIPVRAPGDARKHYGAAAAQAKRLRRDGPGPGRPCRWLPSLPLPIPAPPGGHRASG